MKSVDEMITYHKKSCEQAILDSIQAYYNDDTSSMNDYDANAIEHLRLIEELEKAKEESSLPVYERRGWTSQNGKKE